MADQVTRIGKYQIVEQVGEGAMGVVYRGLDPVLNRPVAVKVMNEGLAQDVALRQRFLREAQAAGSLQHPNVVTIYDFGETDGHLFIAMEFIEGTDLEALLARGTSMPLAARLDIVIDVLNGLAYAHRRGIVHRDIKPANIRIDAEGHARIMDFGVAHLSTSNLTGTGVMMGTPNYMAPEQITSGDVTPATDIFSVGAVLYELLTNTKPFAADTLHRVLFRIVSEPPPDLLAVAPDLPPALAKVIRKALAKEVSQRYANATDMANDLSAVRASLGAPRASRTVSQRSSIEKALSAHRQQQQARDVRRWQIISAAAAVLFVAGGGTAVYFAARGGDGARQGGASTASTAAPGRTDSATRVDSANPPAAPEPALVVAGTPAQRDSQQAAPQQAAPQSPAAEPPTSRTQPPRATGLASAAEQQRVRDSAAAARRQQQRVESPPRTVSRPVAADSTPARTTVDSRDSQQAPPPAPAGQAQGQPAAPVTPLPQPSAPLSSARVDSTPPRVVATPESARGAATAIVAAYARAISTRDVNEIRRVYAGMTEAQQSAWESFFGSVRSMTARLQVDAFHTNGDVAIAQVTGAYEFVTRAGRSERQPAAFEATFQRDGDRWRLQAIK